MSTEKSERILAALSRAKASRQSGNPPTLESNEGPETPEATLTTVSEDEESEATETESDSIETSIEPLPEYSEETETELFEPSEEAEEAESILPLVAASDEERAGIGEETVLPKRFRIEPEEPIRLSGANEIAVLEPSASSRKLPMLLAGIGVVIVLGGASLFLLKDRLWTSKPAQGAVTSAALQMQVESQGNGIINIRWNPESAIVAQAREGRLLIIESGQEPRTVPLGPEQLKIGHLYYQSPVERVEFRLEIVDRSGAVTKESVLALSSVKAAEPQAGPPVAPTTNEAHKEEPPPAVPQTPPVETKRDLKQQAVTAKKPVETSQPKAVVATRSFTPPPNQRKAEEPRALLVDPPPSVPGSGAALPSVNIPDAAVRIAAPPAPVKQPQAQLALKTGGVLQPPKLIKRVTPEYPPAARAAGIQGVVKFTATIAKDGTIHNVQAVSGSSLLIPAATDAVKKWLYQPTMLDGDPVEVVTQIEVNFALHQ